MDNDTKLRRRDFLKYSAFAAAGTIVAACGSGTSGGNGSTSGGSSSGGKGGTGTSGGTGGSSSSPGGSSAVATKGTGGSSGSTQGAAPAPTKTVATDIKYTKGLTYKGQYKESPLLAQQVKAGKLPNVKSRLPENPYVVPHAWVKQGKYGGQMNWVVSDSSDWSTVGIPMESMYGHTPVRWLKDGFEIGPGLAESWESNADLTEWTFHFRKGLKWSDGKPWTVDDITFWWEDMVLNKDYNPTGALNQELLGGDGKGPKMTKIDDNTLKFTYNVTSPLTIDNAAMWVNRWNGPRYMECKHFMKKYHPKYNPAVKKLGKKWVDKFNSAMDFRNPDLPTMNGWMFVSGKTGQQKATFTRNPYYYCIDKWGNQLPYIDTIFVTNIPDAQAMRVNIVNGKFNYVDGFHCGLNLGDVADIKQGANKNKFEILLWDSGSGTASMYFFNRDYQDDNYRKLFRNPKFLQAMSLAYDRANARKAIYFNQGENTTGTMSPKAIEYHVGKGAQVYKAWRDSWNKHDPAKAKQLLDEIGLKDTNGDGFREFPDGSKLQVTLDYGAPGTPEHIQKDELLAGDWKAVGINARPNPVNATSKGTKWANGSLMMTTDWEVGDGPNYLVYPNWVVPMDNSRWAPLEGQWYALRGTKTQNSQKSVSPWKRNPPRMSAEKGDPVDRIWKLYQKTTAEKDFMKRNQIVWEMTKIHYTDGPFFSGTVANYPQVVLKHMDMRNVPTRDDLAQHGFTNPWTMACPAVYDPEAYYFENPDQHTS